MREILAAMTAGHSRARLAFDIYIHRLQAGIGAMVAALGGIDALVFSAGVRENSPEVRAATCSKIGISRPQIRPESQSAASADTDLATPDSRVGILSFAPRIGPLRPNVGD